MDWLERLKIQAHDPDRAVENYVRKEFRDRNKDRPQATAKPPITLDLLQDFEEIAEILFPNDLSRVYLEVGNGGFGPGYGLLGFSNTINMEHDSRKRWDTIDDYYLGHKHSKEMGYGRDWSEYILPICTGGCDCLGIVDLRDERVGFVQHELFEFLEPLENIIEWKAISVKSWFEAWMNGEHLMGYSEQFQKNTIDELFNKHYAS